MPASPAPDVTLEPERLSDLTPAQRRSGLAAWLGWMFDGLDMHLYTLVATPFVAALIGVAASDPRVDRKASIIQAAFLVGWALGGGFFGRIGDILGRRRALILTILTYACFTGLSAVAQTWWHLMIFRFLAALGIGGEWAVGASLLVETWPRKWRPWIAAVLQSAVNIGVLLACVAGWLFEGDTSYRLIFLTGILPALVTLWIRKSVPETEEWQQARGKVTPPGVRELFGPTVWPVTWRTLLICSISLTAHWTFLFWQQKYIRSLPEIAALPPADATHAVIVALVSTMSGSIVGNFLCGWLASLLGYRRAMAISLMGYFLAMFFAFGSPWSYEAALWWWFVIGLAQGVFGLFTMCLPPLFPTLLRTTGAGFCYNFGRIIAALGTVFLGPAAGVHVGDYGQALYYAAFLFVPAAFVSLLLPQEHDGCRASPAS